MMETQQAISATVRFAAEMIRQICLEAGADDAGFVDIAQEGLDSEREGILRVYPATRSIIALIRVMNRENLRSPSRYPANDESHCVGDEFSRICRCTAPGFLDTSIY